MTTYTPPVPITPKFGGTLIVPVYDAPYTLPIPVSQGGPVFISTSLSPIITWDTSGYWAVSLTNGNVGMANETNAYFNAVMLFPETYMGSSNPSLVNSGAYGAHGTFSGSNGFIYALTSQIFGYAYYFGSTSLLTPFSTANNYGSVYHYLGSTDLWRPVSGTTEQAVGTFTAIAPAIQGGTFGMFMVAYQGSGTVAENDTYIGGVQITQHLPAPLSKYYDLGPTSSALYGSNTSQTGEHFVNMWYNQTIANAFRGANLPISGMPNVLMSCYYDGVTNSCYHLFGYNPASGFDAQTGEYTPAMEDIGAFLVPGVTTPRTTSQPQPTALCGLGFFWQTSPSTGVVLEPEGTYYWDLVFVGQSTNAKAALASGYTTIMGDGYGDFWVVTYTLSSSSFYVGNGLAQLLTSPTFQEITANPIPLPCVNPCTFGNML